MSLAVRSELTTSELHHPGAVSTGGRLDVGIWPAWERQASKRVAQGLWLLCTYVVCFGFMFIIKSLVECAAGFVHAKQNIRGHGYQERCRKFVDASLWQKMKKVWMRQIH